MTKWSVCLDNTGYEVCLEPLKLYQVIDDEKSARLYPYRRRLQRGLPVLRQSVYAIGAYAAGGRTPFSSNLN